MSARVPEPTSWARYVQDLGLEIQRRRTALGVSQETLAHRAGMTRTHFQQIEKGYWKPGHSANPSLKAIVGIAQALGVEVGDLVASVDGVVVE